MCRRRRPARRRRARVHRAHPDRQWTPVLHRSLAFLQFAAGPEGTGMRNFGYDNAGWTSRIVGDHVGSTIWALGEILATAWIPAFVAGADASRRTRAIAPRGRLVADCRLHHSRASRASILIVSTATRECCSNGSSNSSRRLSRSAAGSWLWFEDRLSVRPRAALPGAHRRGLGTPTAVRRCHRARVARMAGRRMRPGRRHAAPAGASWTRPR